MLIARSFYPLLPIFLSSLVFVGCGSSFDTIKVKEYHLAVLDDDPQIRQSFASLIEDFNQYAGERVLNYVENPSDANSAIIVTEGLRQRDGKVGWGQWLSEARQDNPIATPGRRPKRVVEFSMRLEFDADYFRSRLEADQQAAVDGLTPAEQADQRKRRFQKQKLFFHEVGHGLEMDHNSDENDVMYYDISGDKEFNSFFNRVRSYYADQ